MNDSFQTSWRIPYAAIAGLCGFTGSLFGKFSGSNEHISFVCFGIRSVWETLFGNYVETSTACKDTIGVLLIRVLFVACMIICNAGVWTFYVKALQASKSSLPATLISNATNFILSALLGSLIFGEATSFLWWSGIILVITGLILVSSKEESKLLTKKQY